MRDKDFANGCMSCDGNRGCCTVSFESAALNRDADISISEMIEAEREAAIRRMLVDALEDARLSLN